MLAYLLRTAPAVLRARLGRGPALVSEVHRRVGLHEIDFNLHMNQAVYAQVLELGRVDWMLRSGAWEASRAQGVSPVIAEQTIVYRRELKPLTRYLIDTRAVGFDGRLLRFESHILVGDKVHTKATVKAIFVGAQGVLSVEQSEAFGRPFLTEPLPVEGWERVRP